METVIQSHLGFQVLPEASTQDVERTQAMDCAGDLLGSTRPWSKDQGFLEKKAFLDCYRLFWGLEGVKDTCRASPGVRG